MSTTLGIETQRADGGAIVRAVGSVMMRWWAAYTAWRIEQWAMRRLCMMRDSQLEDIGLVCSQIEFAVRKGT